MNINLTIFVQALNFLGAYCIIRLLLIKPGIRALEQDKHEVQELSLAVTGKNSALDAQEAERVRRWRLCQRSLEQLTPKPITHFVIVSVPDFVRVPTIPDVEVVQQAQQVENFITKRLNNVRV